MLNVDNICLIPKHKKMTNRVTTFASDSPKDSMVQNDKDVDALMHLKITVVELYKRLLSRLDQSRQIGNILQDWIDDMLWRMTTMIWKNKNNSNFHKAISKNQTFITFCLFKLRHYFKLLSKRFYSLQICRLFLMDEIFF